MRTMAAAAASQSATTIATATATITAAGAEAGAAGGAEMRNYFYGIILNSLTIAKAVSGRYILKF